MLEEIRLLLDRYGEWLKENTAIKQVDNWVEITTPHVDRHNDMIQIYAQKSGEGFTLTDDGYTIRDLAMSGCEINTPKRRGFLEMTLRGFGVQMEGDALVVRASTGNFSLRKHCLVQAMLAVNDLFYLTSPIVHSLFLEDVAAWLKAKDIRFVPRAKFSGRSGYDHWFDFTIPASRMRPERFLQTVNRATKTSAENLIFSWLDTKETRPDPKAKIFAILNDQEARPSESVIEAFRSYEINPIIWSEREDVAGELAA